MLLGLKATRPKLGLVPTPSVFAKQAKKASPLFQPLFIHTSALHVKTRSPLITNNFLNFFGNKRNFSSETTTKTIDAVNATSTIPTIAATPTPTPTPIPTPIPPTPAPTSTLTAAQVTDSPGLVSVAADASQDSFFASLNPLDHVVTWIQALQEFTGLPWWLTIPLVAVSLRVLLMPLTVIQQKKMGQMNKVRREVEKMLKSRPGQFQDPTSRLRTAGNQNMLMQERLRKEGFKFSHLMAPILISTIIYVIAFGALTKLTLTVPALKAGGILWFTDLSERDPTYLLPALSCLTMLGAFELGRLWNPTPGNPTVLWVARAACVFLVGPLLSFATKGMIVGFIATNIFMILQSYILSRPQVKSALGLPLTVVEIEQTNKPVIPQVTYTYNPKKKNQNQTQSPDKK